MVDIIAQEEIFGPVLAIQTFRTMDEVIQKANNTPRGRIRIAFGSERDVFRDQARRETRA